MALSVFVIIFLLLIGSTIYQTYIANPVTDLPAYNSIDPFTLPSTDGTNYTFTPGDHQVTVVSFMYTKCPGGTGCSLLTSNMAILETRVKNADISNIKFLSIDFDYINDTMEDLAHYASEYTSDYELWEFLLGNANQTEAVADQFNFFFAPNNDSGVDLSHATPEGKDPYIHPMLTYMLDRTGTIRLLIQGTDWDFTKLVHSIEFLQSEDWETTK